MDHRAKILLLKLSMNLHRYPMGSFLSSNLDRYPMGSLLSTASGAAVLGDQNDIVDISNVNFRYLDLAKKKFKRQP